MYKLNSHSSITRLSDGASIPADPSLLDLMDGLVKDDAAQIQAYKDACLAVKVLYPK